MGAAGGAESRAAAGGTLSDGDRAASARPAAGTLSEPGPGMESTVSGGASDPVYPEAARLSLGAARLSPEAATRLSEGAPAAVPVDVVCANAAGGAISNCVTDIESATAMWCQYENMEAWVERIGRCTPQL